MSIARRVSCWYYKVMEETLNNGYCVKKGVKSPDCASCGEFAMEDVREEVAGAEGGFASLCFRIFHKNEATRSQWRRKVCKHFEENQPE